jgi:hypothetical protein
LRVALYDKATDVHESSRLTGSLGIGSCYEFLCLYDGSSTTAQFTQSLVMEFLLGPSSASNPASISTALPDTWRIHCACVRLPSGRPGVHGKQTIEAFFAW